MLSAVLLDPRRLDTVRDVVSPDDFWSGANRTIFEAFIDLDVGRETIDPVTLSHHLEAKGALKRIGGTAYIGTVLEATPALANVLEHASIVRRLARLRRMDHALKALSIAAHAAETRLDIDGYLQRCESEIFAVNMQSSAQETASTMHELMASAAVEINTPGAQAVRGVTTGLRDLDQISLGFVPGELWYVAAYTGMGKTSLAGGFLEAVGSTGRGACFFSGEMERDELKWRTISSRSGVPLKGLLLHQLDQRQVDAAVAAIAELDRFPIVVDNEPMLTPSKLRSRIRRHGAELRARYPHCGLSLVVVDYVQLMHGDKPSYRTKNDELEEVSRALKLMAQEFKTTIVALSQLNRGDVKFANKRPGLRDLRGSGALEQDADKVLFIHRAPDDEENGSSSEGDAELILAKGRNSGKGRADVVWQPWCVRFVDRPQERLEFGPTDYD